MFKNGYDWRELVTKKSAIEKYNFQFDFEGWYESETDTTLVVKYDEDAYYMYVWNTPRFAAVLQQELLKIAELPLNPIKEVKFSELCEGDVFHYNGCTYVKEKNKNGNNAIKHNGMDVYINEITMVIL